MDSFNCDKGSFSFCNDKVLQTQLPDGIRLRMKRIGMAVARVYFVEEGGYAEVPIPNGFRIVDHSNGNNLVKPLAGRQEYFIGWTDNYSFIYNDNIVMKLNNQRQWAVQSESSVETLDA